MVGLFSISPRFYPSSLGALLSLADLAINNWMGRFGYGVKKMAKDGNLG
jgi:hypothetical protein